MTAETTKVEKAEFVGNVKVQTMQSSDMDALHRLDLDASVHPWTKEEWYKQWCNEDLYGRTVRQRARGSKKWSVVGYMLFREFDDGVDIERIAVHPYAAHDAIGAALLECVYGKVRILVRERYVPLCKLLIKSGFKFDKMQKNAFVEPDDDGYWFTRDTEKTQGVGG